MNAGSTNAMPTKVARLPIDSVICRVSRSASKRLARGSRFSAKTGFLRSGPNWRPLLKPTATMLNTAPAIRRVVSEEDT